MYYGAGVILISGSGYQLYQNTITQNQNTSTSTSANGGGLYVYGSTTATSVNNIIWENISVTNPNYTGNFGCNYTDTSPLHAGTGNINEDPVFWDRTVDDFRLMAISPCIDAGNPQAPLDPDSTIADMGALYFNQTGGAMFVPYSVTNLSIDHNNAALIATINWTNPTLMANQQPLTELWGVKIYRDGTLVGTVTNVTIGQPSTYNDNTVPAAGEYVYELVPYNSHGDGVPEDGTAWIGLDQPSLPSSFTAVPNQQELLECTLNWSEPFNGAHSAYWPAGSWIGQKIYRNNVLLTTLVGNATTFLDNTIPSEGFYTYGLSYYNNSGEGPVLMSPPVYVGEPEYEVIPYNWVEISGTGTNTGITNDDQTVGPFNIGFSFPWYGTSFVNQVYVCSNGWLSFSSGQGSGYTNTTIPNSATPNNVIYPYWDDLTPVSGGVCYYYYDAANQRFIVEWRGFHSYSTGGELTYEVILYPNGDIDMVYNVLNPGTPNNATLGIENSSGTTATQITYNGSGPLNPTSQMGIRIYTVNAGTQDVTITLTPSGTITIPAGGGTFNYSLLIHNNETTPATFDAWLNVTLPNGGTYPIQLRNLTLPGGGQVSRNMTQAVPASAPAGAYTFHGYVGASPSVIWDQDSFPFTKTAADNGIISPYNEWLTWGWDGETSPFPTVYSLQAAYPNPFNPTTNITYTMPEAGMVELVVYDVQGREAARLVDDYQSQGEYIVSFNAANLSSGVYFAVLNANGHKFTQKMLLVK